MKLEGSLTTFPLRELIDMIVYSSVTGVLNVYSPGQPGQIFFRDGTLYHIERGPARGVDALAELLEHADVRFAFVNNVQSEAETIWGSLTMHLQTAERTASRWHRIRAYIPTLDLTPTLVISRDQAIRRIGPAHYPVLGLIDGQHSLRQIASELGWAQIDVAEAVTQFSLDSLVNLQAPATARQDQPVTASTSGRNGNGNGNGVFDRLLGRSQTVSRPSEAVEPVRAAPPERRPEDLILQMLRS